MPMVTDMSLILWKINLLRCLLIWVLAGDTVDIILPGTVLLTMVGDMEDIMIRGIIAVGMVLPTMVGTRPGIIPDIAADAMVDITEDIILLTIIIPMPEDPLPDMPVREAGITAAVVHMPAAVLPMIADTAREVQLPAVVRLRM